MGEYCVRGVSVRYVSCVCVYCVSVRYTCM